MVFSFAPHVSIRSSRHALVSTWIKSEGRFNVRCRRALLGDVEREREWARTAVQARLPPHVGSITRLYDQPHPTERPCHHACRETNEMVLIEMRRLWVPCRPIDHWAPAVLDRLRWYSWPTPSVRDGGADRHLPTLVAGRNRGTRLLHCCASNGSVCVARARARPVHEGPGHFLGQESGFEDQQGHRRDLAGVANRTRGAAQ